MQQYGRRQRNGDRGNEKLGATVKVKVKALQNIKEAIKET